MPQHQQFDNQGVHLGRAPKRPVGLLRLTASQEGSWSPPPRDTADRLDVDKVARIARTAFNVALELANSDGRPVFNADSGGGS